MRLEELPGLGGLMRREIVDDHVDLFTAGLVDHDVSEEGDKLRRGVPRSGASQHLSGLGVKGGIERERTVTVILKAVSLGPPGGERQDRIEPVERLDRGLLVDTKDGRVLRRGLLKN